MSTQSLRYRQVHLDFHTSEAITPIGEKFDAKQFQEALQRGHVDSVTLFSKCHHGLSYHETEIGQRHPGLDFDLLVRQIEACRAIDVKCPIYISAGLDELAARNHPEWIAVNREGRQFNPLNAAWKAVAFDTPYLDYLCAQIEEVVDNLDAEDGIFLDIIAPRPNYSPLGLAAMAAAGVDPRDEAQVTAWSYQVLQTYFQRTTAASKKGNPHRRVFHNSGHIPKGAYQFIKWNSHLELESLPTGGWGYDHFPVSAKYAATTGYDFLGMTGKFHTTWGEFGGFKRDSALRYECAAMLAFGSKCSIGDQLHPSGEMNLDTYNLIGTAYAEVETNEPWARGAVPVSEIALLSPESLHTEHFGGHGHKFFSEEGAARMLLELGHQFDIVDTTRDLTSYKVLILPEEIWLDGGLLEKVRAFIAGSGKLVIAGHGAFDKENSAFALDLGLKLVERSPWNPDYLVPTDLAPKAPVRGPFVVHHGAWNVEAGEGWQVLAARRDPYFNREWDHFCSHQHTPDARDSQYPGAISNGNVVYFAHDIFTAYRQLGQPLYRDLFADALKTLLPAPTVTASLPTAGRSSLMLQAADQRYVLHLLFALPQKRGADRSTWNEGKHTVELIEDLFPLHDVRVEVRVSHSIKSVKLAPAGQELEFTPIEGGVQFTVPKVLCHQMVELSY